MPVTPKTQVRIGNRGQRIVSRGQNSIEFIAKLRTLPLEQRPYIIYLVTENDPHEIKRALASGADSFLLKPFNREIIEMKLAEIRVTA